MTSTGFVAFSILQTLCGAAGVTAAAVATIVVGVIMFPVVVAMLERDAGGPRATGGLTAALRTVRYTVVNPLILSTVAGHRLVDAWPRDLAAGA